MPFWACLQRASASCVLGYLPHLPSPSPVRELRCTTTRSADRLFPTPSTRRHQHRPSSLPPQKGGTCGSTETVTNPHKTAVRHQATIWHRILHNTQHTSYPGCWEASCLLPASDGALQGGQRASDWAVHDAESLSPRPLFLNSRLSPRSQPAAAWLVIIAPSRASSQPGIRILTSHVGITSGTIPRRLPTLVSQASLVISFKLLCQL